MVNPVHAVTTPIASGTWCLDLVGTGTINRRPRAQPRRAGMAPTAPASTPPHREPVLTTADACRDRLVPSTPKPYWNEDAKLCSDNLRSLAAFCSRAFLPHRRNTIRRTWRDRMCRITHRRRLSIRLRHPLRCNSTCRECLIGPVGRSLRRIRRDGALWAARCGVTASDPDIDGDDIDAVACGL
jgi:hypothetical protein